MTDKEKNKSDSANELKLLKEASKEVDSWPGWLKKNAELLFEDEQEKQRTSEKMPKGYVIDYGAPDETNKGFNNVKVEAKLKYTKYVAYYSEVRDVKKVNKAKK